MKYGIMVLLCDPPKYQIDGVAGVFNSLDHARRIQTAILDVDGDKGARRERLDRLAAAVLAGIMANQATGDMNYQMLANTASKSAAATLEAIDALEVGTKP